MSYTLEIGDPIPEDTIKIAIDSTGIRTAYVEGDTIPEHRTASDILKETTSEFTNLIQEYMNNEAKLNGYESLLSACSYAGAVNSYQAEGQSFIIWRSTVWDYSYAQLAEIQTGLRSMPTPEEFLLELPPRVIPA